MSITDMIISALMKKGVLYEARNVDIEFKIPKDTVQLPGEIKTLTNVTVNFKAEHMSIKIEKE